jgi:hypothetical protein
MIFRVVLEGPYCLFLGTQDGHELAVYLVDTPSGRGFDARPSWNGRKPRNSGEITEAAIIFTQEHTHWVSLPQPMRRMPGRRSEPSLSEREAAAGQGAGRQWSLPTWRRVKGQLWPSVLQHALAR